MKCVRTLLVVTVLVALVGCTTAPAVQDTSSAQTQTKNVSVASVAQNYSMIRYADERIIVFILVDEPNFTLIGDQIEADWTKKPNGLPLTRDEAVRVLGDDKTTGVDAKLRPTEKGSEFYWVTTSDRVKALLREF
ncbi:hypothetical protein D3C85_290370 [compost metagenome]